MPLVECYYHQLPNKQLLLLQGTDVFIDPDTLEPIELIEWAFELEHISSTERLALIQVMNEQPFAAAPSKQISQRMHELKVLKEKWIYETCEGLSDPASRMYDHLRYFKSASNFKAQQSFDETGLLFSSHHEDLVSQKTAIIEGFSELQKLIQWFELHYNLLITFSKYVPKLRSKKENSKTEKKERAIRKTLKHHHLAIKPASKNN